jgi:pimeloyl-ACP methyl ester carboxylesterase
MRPETKYTKSGDVHIAYQVAGDGPIDLVVVPGFISHVEYIWEEPRAANFLRRLASFSRVIMFDKRGTGLSDHFPRDKYSSGLGACGSSWRPPPSKARALATS